MKKLLYLLLFAIIGFRANAQTPFTNYGALGVSESTIVSVKGSLYNESTGNIKNAGLLYITDSLNNNSDAILFGRAAGSYDEAVGKVIFNGTSAQVITGVKGIAFTRLILNNNDTLILDTDIWCKDSLYLQAGNIFLNSNNITLEPHLDGGNVTDTVGAIYGENENNRIFGTEGEIVANNYSLLSGVETNVANLGFYIEPKQSLEKLCIKRGHYYYPNAADTSIYRYYTVLDTGSTGIEGSVTLNYLDKEYNPLISTTETDFKLWYSSDNAQSFSKIPSVWNISNQVASINEIPLSAGIYTISDEICDVLPEANITDIEICELDSIHLQAAPTYNEDNEYFWSSTDIDISALNINNFFLDVPWDTIEGHDSIIFYLLVRNPNGCENFDSATVVIKTRPIVNLSNLTYTHCVGESIYFVAPPGMDSYSWDLGNANNDINVDSLSYAYYIDGQYTVNLTVDSMGCTTDSYKTISIFPLPSADFNFEDGCAMQNVSFENTAAVSGYGNPVIATSIWNYGEGENDTITSDPLPHVNFNGDHLYSSSNTFAVKLIVQSNQACTDSITKPIIISPSITANFISTNVCYGDTVHFTNLTNLISGSTYSWNFGDGSTTVTNSSSPNATHLYDAEGSYNVILTAETGSGCIHDTSFVITIYPKVTAAFTVEDVCFNENSIFVNNSTPLFGNTYQWNFGDGNTSSDINPVHLYGFENMYQVQLIVITDNACADTITISHNVNQLPTADFNIDDVCLGETSWFNNTSTNNSETNYYWDFGNAITATSNSLNPDVNTLYTTAGVYPIELIVENSFLCRDTMLQTVTVKPIPAITLNDTSATCTGNIVLDPGNSGSNFIWSTGATTQTITVANEDLYSVTVTNPVTTCSNTFTTQVLLNSTVVVNLGADQSVCDSLILDAGYFTSYNWSTSETGQTIIANTTGVYHVTVTDINNCIAYDTINLTVNYSPIVNLGSDVTVCRGTAVSIDAQNTGANYSWNNLETSQQIDVTSTGAYTVTITDVNNCSAVSNTVQVVIHDNPEYPFEDDNVFACNSVILDAQNLGSAYVWNNGADTQTTEILSSGLYFVEITNTNNCSVTDSIMVHMNYINELDLGNDTVICEGNSILLNSNDTSSNNTYLWNNNATSQQLQVASAGQWMVTKYSINGCTSSDTINISVNPTPVFNLGEDLYLCSNSGLELRAPIVSDSYEWRREGGIISTEQQLTINNTGTYILTLNNSDNCSYTDSISIEATPFLTTPQFLVKSQVQVGDTLQFVNLTYPEPNSYYWAFGDGVSSTTADPMHIYYMEGTFNVYFEAVTGNCNASVVKQVTVSGYARNIKQSLKQPIHYAEIIDFVSANLFPNPTRGRFNLEVELTQKTDIMFVVFDMQGRVLKDKIYKDEFYIFEQYDYSHLNTGMYFVKVLVGDKHKLFKVIIQ